MADDATAAPESALPAAVLPAELADDVGSPAETDASGVLAAADDGAEVALDAGVLDPQAANTRQSPAPAAAVQRRRACSLI